MSHTRGTCCSTGAEQEPEPTFHAGFCIRHSWAVTHELFYSHVPSTRPWGVVVSLILQQWSHTSTEKWLCVCTALSQETVLSVGFEEIRRCF